MKKTQNFQNIWHRNFIYPRVNRSSKLGEISWRIVNFRLKNLHNDASFHIRYPRKCGFHVLRLEFFTSRFCFLTSERIAEFQSNWFKKVWFWCFDFKITKDYAIEALWFENRLLHEKNWILAKSTYNPQMKFWETCLYETDFFVDRRSRPYERA